MKKSILGLVSVIFAISCLFLTSCGKEVISIEIVNTTYVDLNIESVDLCGDVYTMPIGEVNGYCWYNGSGGYSDNFKNNTTISSNSSSTITVDFSSINNYDVIKLNCSYQTSLGTTAYPYIGTLDGENVKTYYRNNSETEKYKTTNACLNISGNGNTILNFVRTASGDYVLCIVK